MSSKVSERLSYTSIMAAIGELLSATASPTGHLNDGEIEALITVALLVCELSALPLMLCRC
jgi:hypothetical protein